MRFVPLPNRPRRKHARERKDPIQSFDQSGLVTLSSTRLSRLASLPRRLLPRWLLPVLLTAALEDNAETCNVDEGTSLHSGATNPFSVHVLK